ncbi:hypothetical protein [Streptomyces sp. NPDC002265]|uniref:hypothetical protein n=1 Tax=Streptomyces sp. NPDC002265 TaxID=3154415 RepID=UPI00332559B5
MACWWDEATAAQAAALAARAVGRDLIVVEEDGSHRLYAAEGAEDFDAGRAMIVYRRGDSYLVARRRNDTVAAGPHDSEAEVRRKIREGKRPARDNDPAGDYQ